MRCLPGHITYTKCVTSAERRQVSVTYTAGAGLLVCRYIIAAVLAVGTAGKAFDATRTDADISTVHGADPGARDILLQLSF